jgi:6-phosphogluconolactonase
MGGAAPRGPEQGDTTMHRRNRPPRRAVRRTVAAGTGALAALALAGTAAAASPATAPTASGPGHDRVYAISNDSGTNRLLVFDQHRDGTLRQVESVVAGGSGSGTGLGTQGAVATSDGGHLVIAVDPGSDQVSMFVQVHDHMTLVDTEASGGDRPSSLTIDAHTLYVLNAGSGNNVAGFHIGRRGLEPIPGSVQPLSRDDAGGAQVSFTPDGRALVVTEKNTNRIDTFQVRHGVAEPAVVSDSTGQTPFGFAFGRHGELVVSNAAGGAPAASSVSTYALAPDGHARPLDGPVPTQQTSACWLVVDGRFAYAANTGSASLTGYALEARGHLAPLTADGHTATAGAAPADTVVSRDGRYLYERNGGDGTIGMFRVGADGNLTALGFVNGLPAAAAGLAFG